MRGTGRKRNPIVLAAGILFLFSLPLSSIVVPVSLLMQYTVWEEEKITEVQNTM